MKKVKKRIASTVIALAMTCGMIVIPASAEAPVTTENTVIRGTDRYDTAFRVAQSVKKVYNVSKLNNIIIANGLNFPDALSGAYLATKTKAAIIFTDGTKGNIAKIENFMKANCTEKCNVFLLGGNSVVSADVEKALKGYTTKRLAGKTRYDTNLSILKNASASSESEFFICCGDNFPDALAASAVKKPIMIVNKNGLTSEQVSYLKTLKNKKFTIIGGEGAVPKKIETQLKKYGTVNRVFGANRYETCEAINEKYKLSTETAVFASGEKFPDALSGSALATATNGAIVLGEAPKSSATAPKYKSINPTKAYYLGDIAETMREQTNKPTGTVIKIVENVPIDGECTTQWGDGKAYNSSKTTSGGKAYYQTTIDFGNDINKANKVIFFDSNNNVVEVKYYGGGKEVYKGKKTIKTTFAWNYCVFYKEIEKYGDFTSDINSNGNGVAAEHPSQYVSAYLGIDELGVSVNGAAAVGEKAKAKAFIGNRATILNDSYCEDLTEQIKLKIKHYNPKTKKYVVVDSPIRMELYPPRGDTFGIVAMNDFKLSFTSSNASVVKMDSQTSCNYTIKGKGSATITCTIMPNFTPYTMVTKVAEIKIPVRIY